MTGFYVIAAVLAAIVGLAAWAYRKGRKEARQETALEAAERYAKTRKEIDNAEDDVGDDPDAARRWLRERAQQ